ncbi:MAG: acetyl-CoA C-acetyltransferase [Vulcanibacillus sp.]
MREAVIVAGVRTAVGKASKGTLKDTRPDELGAVVLEDLLKRTPGLIHNQIDDVILGCSFPEGEQGMNVARNIVLRAGLPTSVPATTVNRYCSSGLQTIAIATEKIMAGFADVVIAGGIESMSMIPLGGSKPAPNPWLMENMPEAYMPMGLTAEEVANRFSITREEQDAFAVQSHQRAAKAIQEGKYKAEIVPVKVKKTSINENGKIVTQELVFDTDEGVRADANLEALAKLKPVFSTTGSVTAGNSSQTSDGAAAVMIMSREKAEELGLKPIAKLITYAVAGVDPDIMGVGPKEAIPKALKRAGLTLEDIDLFEINEAFASQAVYVVKELGLDNEKVNVNGGAIALGHPLGCTGAKLTVSLINELKRRNGKYGIVSMCIGGGMGAAGIFEIL